MTPFLIAVSGGSGSGKSTFVSKLWNRLEATRPLVLSIDHYYRDLRHLPYEERVLQNFDHPDAIERDILIAQVEELRHGRAVERPGYDFHQHARTDGTERIEPSPIIIIDGIFSLCFAELLPLLDLKLYLEVDADMRVVRRIRRDMAERGRSFDSCAAQYLGTVKAMHEAFIEPTKKNADFIIPWHQFNERTVASLATLIEAGVLAKATPRRMR